GGSFIAADQLDQDVETGRRGEFDRVIEPGDLRHIHATVAAAVARRNGPNDDFATSDARQRLAARGENSSDRRADCAETGDTNTKGSVIERHGWINRERTMAWLVPDAGSRGKFRRRYLATGSTIPPS